jgi:hypothetical protein
VVVGSAPVVVGSGVGSVVVVGASVVVGAAVVVGAVVVVVWLVVAGVVVVVGAVVVLGAVTEGWRVVAVTPACAWAVAGPGGTVSLRRSGGTVSGVGGTRVGVVVGAREPVVGVDADLDAGSA